MLWSLDDYYYYAFCIALISAVSIVSTLMETRKVGGLYFLTTFALTIVLDDHSYA